MESFSLYTCLHAFFHLPPCRCCHRWPKSSLLAFHFCLSRESMSQSNISVTCVGRKWPSMIWDLVLGNFHAHQNWAGSLTIHFPITFFSSRWNAFEYWYPCLKIFFFPLIIFTIVFDIFVFQIYQLCLVHEPIEVCW